MRSTIEAATGDLLVGGSRDLSLGRANRRADSLD